MFGPEDIIELKELLKGLSKAVIVTHKNPDGDAIGSSLGLYHFLIKKGIQAQVITPNEYPDFLRWLPSDDTVIRYNTDTEKAKAIIDDTEAIFILDLNQMARMDGLQNPVGASKATRVLIDHHQLPDQIADIMLSRPGTSSTSEMVYHLISALGEEDLLDKNAAECLYTGIMTDTGSFRFSSTTSNTHLAAAALMDLGVEPSLIFEKVENSNSENRLKLLGYTLSNKMRVFEDQHTCVMELTEDELAQHEFKKGDTEGLVNYGLSISGVKMSVLFIQQDGIIKISFRSIGTVPVNMLAKKYFNGGGHVNAAGGMWPGSLDEAVERFIEVLPELHEELRK